MLPLAVVTVAGAGAGLTWWLLSIAATGPGASVQIDAIRTGLTAAVGTGGAFALLLAFRRQRSTEISAVHTIADATERRVTELYTKAADQLGSDKAPVRLAGLYALERLAQDNTGQRSTIINVLCAYLRMPYAPPHLEARWIARRSSHSLLRLLLHHEIATSPDPAENEKRAQEHQVRTTAQRILQKHLIRTPHELRWDEQGLDLSGAYLVQATFPGVHLTGADLSGANLTQANLFNADLTGASLSRANLTRANLSNADLTGANLNGANLTDAHLTDADLTAAKISTADLRGASLRKADLTRADFSGAILVRANLKEARLFNAYLRHADLTGAHLDWATWDNNTTLPLQLRDEIPNVSEEQVGGLYRVQHEYEVPVLPVRRDGFVMSERHLPRTGWIDL